MWLNIAAKLVPGMIKTGMSIASNRRKAKELESIAEMNHAQKMADGQIDYQKAVMDNNNQGWKEKLDLFFEYFNNFPEFYKWLVLGIFGSIYGLKPGMDLFKKK